MTDEYLKKGDKQLAFFFFFLNLVITSYFASALPNFKPLNCQLIEKTKQEFFFFFFIITQPSITEKV